MRKRLLWLGAGLLLVGSLLALSVSQRLAPAAAEASEVLFVVEPGDSLGRIARRLEGAGLVRDARAVEWLARFQGLASSLHAVA